MHRLNSSNRNTGGRTVYFPKDDQIKTAQKCKNFKHSISDESNTAAAKSAACETDQKRAVQYVILKKKSYECVCVL